MNIERTKAIVTIVVTAAVNVANVCGYALDADQWVNVALSVLSAIAILYSWWKNQNVTESAQKAQIYLDELRSKEEDADA